MCLEAGEREEPIPGVVRNDWGRTKWNSHKPSHSKGGETQLMVLQSLCVSLGSRVVEMETEGSRVMRSPADEERRFL